MRGELVITERELQTRFQGERDLVTLAPYEVGDRVVRCGNCHAVVKSEYVTSGECPLCGHTPFNPSPVIIDALEYVAPVRVRRTLHRFFAMLLLSACSSLVPFAFANIREFLTEASFDLSIGWVITLFIAFSFTSILILMCNCTSKAIWQNARAGWLLAFIPGAVPYALLCSIWAVIIIVQIVIVILLIGLCIAAIVGLIAAFSN